jgi:uncharacterized protein (DUF362 family)
MRGTPSRVALAKTDDRVAGVRAAVSLLGVNPAAGRAVVVKPNCNTADPYPGSTHNDTLATLLELLREMGATGITVADRCGPAKTDAVFREKGLPQLCERHGAQLLNLEELLPAEWLRVKPPGSHWRAGFDVARPVVEAPCSVNACNLKTHGFGGVFTLSLKNAIGITHKRNMRELHSSFISMRKMIAEVNTAWSPDLVVLDGIEAFVDGGPMTGTKARAGVILAGTDRVAVDAVALAVLKNIGANRAISGKPIFAQEQIARAIELGLGAAGPGEIELATGDAASAAYAGLLRGILDRG